MNKIIHILILTIVFNLNFSWAQEKTRIEKISVSDKLFTGTIDKYPITLYLKFYKLSEGDRNIYSVKGWYYYDKYKKKIPLTGIYDGGLTLYNFKDLSSEKKVLEFSWNEKNSFWDYVEEYKNIIGYNEKFVYNPRFQYNQSSQENLWTNGSKKMNFLLNTDDLQIFKEREYLKSGNKLFVDLYNLGFDKNFSIINSVQTTSEIRILLQFSYTLRAYALGICGAGTEFGYILLKYDSQYNLIDYQRYLLESCEESLDYEGKQLSNSIIRYTLSSYNKEKDDILPKIIYVNTKKAEINTEN